MTCQCRQCGNELTGRQVKYCSSDCKDSYWRLVVEQGKVVKHRAEVKARLARAPKPEMTIECLVEYAKGVLK